MAYYPFGNYYDEQEAGPRGPPVVGFKLMNDGHYDMTSKILKNCQNPEEDSDAVTKTFVESQCLHIQEGKAVIDAKGKRIGNVGDPKEPRNVVTKRYLEEQLVTHTIETQKMIKDLETTHNADLDAIRSHISNLMDKTHAAESLRTSLDTYMIETANRIKSLDTELNAINTRITRLQDRDLSFPIV